MERRRREFAVGEGDLHGEEEKGVCCGGGRSPWRGGEGSLLWEEDLYGVRRGRDFAVGDGDLHGEEEKGVCCGRGRSLWKGG
jgi:hypothetical protein